MCTCVFLFWGGRRGGAAGLAGARGRDAHGTYASLHLSSKCAFLSLAVCRQSRVCEREGGGREGGEVDNGELAVWRPLRTLLELGEHAHLIICCCPLLAPRPSHMCIRQRTPAYADARTGCRPQRRIGALCGAGPAGAPAAPDGPCPRRQRAQQRRSNCRRRIAAGSRRHGRSRRRRRGRGLGTGGGCVCCRGRRLRERRPRPGRHLRRGPSTVAAVMQCPTATVGPAHAPLAAAAPCQCM